MKSEILRSKKYAGVSVRTKKDGTRTFYIRYKDEATGKEVIKLSATQGKA